MSYRNTKDRTYGKYTDGYSKEKSSVVLNTFMNVPNSIETITVDTPPSLQPVMKSNKFGYLHPLYNNPFFSFSSFAIGANLMNAPYTQPFIVYVYSIHPTSRVAHLGSVRLLNSKHNTGIRKRFFGKWCPITPGSINYDTNINMILNKLNLLTNDPNFFTKANTDLSELMPPGPKLSAPKIKCKFVISTDKSLVCVLKIEDYATFTGLFPDTINTNIDYAIKTNGEIDAVHNMTLADIIATQEKEFTTNKNNYFIKITLELMMQYAVPIIEPAFKPAKEIKTITVDDALPRTPSEAPHGLFKLA